MEVNTRKVWPVDYRWAVVGVPIMCPKCGCKRVGVVHETDVRSGVKRRLRECAHCGKQWSEYHVFEHTATADEWNAKGEKVILVRKETSPEDVGGMHAAQGILTATGGKTSHAAVVARGWGKCCIVGCEKLDIDYENGY